VKKLALTVAVAIALSTGVAMADPAPAASATPLQVRPSKPLDLQHSDSHTPIGYKLLAAAVVIGGAVVWAKKRKGASVTKDKKKRSSIDLLARHSLGVRNELLVVDVEGTRLLVGMTPGSMSTLAVLQTPEGVVGEESPLMGEEKYMETAEKPVLAVEEVSSVRPAPVQDEVDELEDKVRSLLAARKKQHAPLPKPSTPARRSKPQPKAAVPGQAKGLLLSMQEDDRPIMKLGDW
jgi:flagellar biogenesis protein FliO